MYHKTKTYSLVLCMLLAFTFGNANIASATEIETPVRALTEEEIAIRMNQMTKRVEEIKSMDRSSLSKQERKELRKELKEMNKAAKAMGQGGVYLSVGAIIIIILLLILIL
jgi:hypothetical protein